MLSPTSACNESPPPGHCAYGCDRRNVDGADDHVGVEDQRHAEVVDRRQRSDRPRAARRREIKGLRSARAVTSNRPSLPIAAHVDLPMVNLLARDAVVRDVVWGTMSLLRFVQPVRSLAGKRDVAARRRARRNGPRYAADVIDPAILRTFLALRAPRNGCGRNELRAGIDAVEWVRELRRSIAVIVDSHAADAAARIAESQPGPRRTDAADRVRCPEAEYPVSGVDRCRRGNRSTENGPDFRQRVNGVTSGNVSI